METLHTQVILAPFLREGVKASVVDDHLAFPIAQPTDGLKANAYYFDHPEWAEEYLIYCHRSESFRSRWLAAIGDWTGKVVVDIGCGPGNIFATLQEQPKLLMGVDVAPKSLGFAAQLGYTTLLVDATDLLELANISLVLAATDETTHTPLLAVTCFSLSGCQVNQYII